MGKLLCVFALIAVTVATAQQSTLPAAKPAQPAAMAVEARLRKAWENFKNRNKQGYGAALADDATQIWADNKPERDKQTAVKDVDSITMNSYALSNLKFFPLGPDAMLSTYQVKVDGLFGAQPFNATLAVSEVWVKRSGEWKSLRYHESELK